MANTHCPYAVLVNDDRERCATGTFQNGVMVEVIVHGARHGYDTVRRQMWKEAHDSKNDWREEFLHVPGRIISWKGILYCKERAMQVVGLYLTRAGVNGLSNVTFARSHRHRRR